MNQIIEKEQLGVLLACTQLTPVREIKKQLDETIGLDCELVECSKLSQCLDLLKDKKPVIDIILLDLALVSIEDSETFFQKIQNVSEGKPIVAFTRPENRELALFLVRGGASIVSSESLKKIESHHLRDVIEYAWIRHGNKMREREINKAEMEDQQKRHDADFEYERVQSADRLKLKDWVISRLRRRNSTNQFDEDNAPRTSSRDYSQSLEERHSKDMIRERQKSADALQAEKIEGAERLKSKDQIIAWLRGSYSLDTSGEKLED